MQPCRLLLLHRAIPGAIVALAVGPAALAADTSDVRATAQLQTWGTLWDQDVDPQADPAGIGDPEDDPGVGIQRARVGLEGAGGPLLWDVEIGVGDAFDALSPAGEIGLVDAYAGGAFPVAGAELRLFGGIQKVPFSRELMFSSRDLVFQERAVAAVYQAPVRDAGVLAELVTDGGFRARGGIFNGNDDILGDDNIGKLIVGRIEWANGDTYTTWSHRRDSAVGVGLSAMQDVDLATSSVSVGADLLARIGRLSLLGEVAQRVQSPRNVDVAPPDVLEGTRRLGGTGQVSYLLPVGGGADEGVEVAARVSALDFATQVTDNTDVGLLHLGATWWNALPGFDVGAGAVHRMELGGRSLPNDTLRVWMQIRAGARVAAGGEGSLGSEWSTGFVGTWTAQGELEGATLALWEQPGMGLVGSFKMDRPRGQVVVGRPYPLDSISYERSVLRVRMDPYGEGRDVVWFELSPAEDGRLCGFGYEDGRREEALNGEGGGAWICWSRGG